MKDLVLGLSGLQRPHLLLSARHGQKLSTPLEEGEAGTDRKSDNEFISHQCFKKHTELRRGWGKEG
jgi:hypothetical protein